MSGDVHLHAGRRAQAAGAARLPRDGRAGGAHLSVSHRGLREVSVRQRVVFPLDAAATIPIAGTAVWVAPAADRAIRLISLSIGTCRWLLGGYQNVWSSAAWPPEVKPRRREDWLRRRSDSSK